MKQSSWTSTSCTSWPKIPVILWSPKVHDFIHNSSPLSLILIQMNTVFATHPISLRSNLILYSHLPLDLPIAPFLYVFLPKPCMHFYSHTHTHHVHGSSNLPFLIIRIYPSAGQKFGLFEPTWPPQGVGCPQQYITSTAVWCTGDWSVH